MVEYGGSVSPGEWLCHPDDPELPDCYRLVTVYQEPVGLRKERHDLPLIPARDVDYEALIARLGQPAEVLPALRELLSTPGVLDES